MPKGGPRIPSARNPIGRAMGLQVFFNVIEEVKRVNNWVTVYDLHRLLHFGGERSETCRAHVKECLRHGFVEVRKQGGIKYYRLSEKGAKFLNIPPSLRPFALAWSLVHFDREQFVQLHKILDYLMSDVLPVNYEEAGDLTEVDHHGAKVILFGWLEPLGFLQRLVIDNKQFFKLNRQYFDKLSSMRSMEEAIPVSEPLIIKCSPKRLFLAPELHASAVVNVSIINLGPNRVETILTASVHELIRNFFTEGVIRKTVVIEPLMQIKTSLQFPLKKEPVSESFASIELGELEASFLDVTIRKRLPKILLTTKADYYEKQVGDILRDIGLETITKGKSDRPDAIVAPVRLACDLDEFLGDEEFKILVEITSSPLGWQKVVNDLEKFERHRKKVHKIRGAKRTLITAPEIESKVYEYVSMLDLKQYQPFTIISIPTLKYLKDRCKKNGVTDWALIGQILCHDGCVDNQFIDKAIENYCSSLKKHLQSDINAIKEIVSEGKVQEAREELNLLRLGLIVPATDGFIPSTYLLNSIRQGLMIHDLIRKRITSSALEADLDLFSSS